MGGDIFLDFSLDSILDAVLTDDFKGRYGEKLTEKELKKVSFFGCKGEILRNVYIPKDNGETSEIDVLFICQKGIFVFESKNYSGWIFGNEKDQYWTTCLAGGQKNRFYNPIKQNRTHLKWLNNYLNAEKLEVPLFSIIVFSERCKLKKVITYSEGIVVIKRDKIYKNVKRLWDASADVLSDEQVELIYEKLKLYTNVDEAVKAAHVQNIKNRYKDGTNEDCNNVTETNDLICLRCGSKLFLRTAKKGQNAGNQFYGCSAFPKCRYIRKE